MNQRILEFARQTGLCDADGDFFGGKIGQYKEFVQLIVQECAERLLNDAKLTDIQTARCVASIREHFGVEE